jgi:AcrR family transcriptional regulator
VFKYFKGGVIIIQLENQKEIIFATAKEIIQSENSTSFSIRMISKKCNIGIGTIYKYYGNKEDILIDITKDLWMSYLKEVQENGKDFHVFIHYIEYLYERLDFYTRTFNYQVLSKELSTTFTTVGKSHHTKAQTAFNHEIKSKISTLYNLSDDEASVLSLFIANNLMAIITIQEYDFATFKKILLQLTSTYEEKKS